MTRKAPLPVRGPIRIVLTRDDRFVAVETDLLDANLLTSMMHALDEGFVVGRGPLRRLDDVQRIFAADATETAVDMVNGVVLEVSTGA